jgi:hypothetical protein
MAERKKMQLREVEAGGVIYREGDAGDAVYIVQKGEVEITRKSGDENVRLTTLREGAIFGEMGVLRNKPRSTTVLTANGATLIVVTKEDFMAAFGTENSLALQLLRLLCERLSKADQYIIAHPDLTIGAEIAHAENIRLLPASPTVETQIGAQGIEISALPYRIGCHTAADHRTSISPTNLLLRAPGNYQIAASHMIIENVDGQIVARDLGSHLGTLVNGVRLAKFEASDHATLKYGDNDVQLGSIESPYHFRVIIERAIAKG